ncbi:hypothetical protein Tco_0995941 [Tanacetum coccineum]
MPSSLSPEPTIGYIDDLDFFKDFENEFPAIAYNNDLKSKSDPLIEPSVSSRHIDKFDSKNETSLSEYVEEEQNILYFNDSFPLDVIFPNNLKTNKDNDDNIDITQPSGNMAPLPSKDQRHTWLRYQGEARGRMTWRQFILALGLHTEVEMEHAGFGAYWQGSERVIPDKGDLRDYWMEISFDRDFLGLAPNYAPKKVTGVNLFYLRNMDRGNANVPYLLAQYLFRHDDGRKSGARLFGGHFIGCLAAYFGMVSDQGLRGLSVVTRELPLIDLHELERLNICIKVGDTWAWVSLGPERQPDAAAGAPRSTKDAPTVDEGAQADPTPVQAPQPSPLAPRTMHQRIFRLEEEVQELRRSVVRL